MGIWRGNRGRRGTAGIIAATSSGGGTTADGGATANASVAAHAKTVPLRLVSITPGR